MVWTGKRTSTCQCPGRDYRVKWHRWGVLKRLKLSAQVKCKECGWVWWSKCQYRQLIPDHKPRSRKGLTHQHVLHRLLAGTLRIDPVTSVVESNATGEWVALTQRPDSHNSGYRFIEVSHRGMKRKIGVHVLQWMQEHRRVVPAGYNVHHKKSPPRPYPKDNALSNVELLKAEINQAEWRENTERVAA